MTSINLHFLDERNKLKDVRAWLYHCLTETHKRAATLMPLQPLDVVIQSGEEILPEKGHSGFTPKSGVIFITVDPNHPALKANIDNSLERTFAHELHHAARWDEVGYGSSLGEALVSEGLAGHFVLELLGGSPEPWERLSENITRAYEKLAAQEWENADYNHDIWFFGGGEFPRWIGYSLGFRIVERFLSKFPNSRASNLLTTTAEDFRSMIWPAAGLSDTELS